MKHETFVEGLTKVLVKRKVIPAQEAEALKKAFHDSPKPNFDEFLLDEGLVDKDDLLPALADLYEVPYFDAQGYFFDHQMVRMFPKEFLRSNAIIPIERDENMLIVLASDPTMENLVPRISEWVSDDIQFRVGLRQDILDAIQEFYDQSLASVDYDQDIDEDTDEREKDIEEHQELETLAYEDFEPEDRD